MNIPDKTFRLICLSVYVDALLKKLRVLTSNLEKHFLGDQRVQSNIVDYKVTIDLTNFQSHLIAFNREKLQIM